MEAADNPFILFFGTGEVGTFPAGTGLRPAMPWSSLHQSTAMRRR